jgi:hypothetical protein
MRVRVLLYQGSTRVTIPEVTRRESHFFADADVAGEVRVLKHLAGPCRRSRQEAEESQLVADLREVLDVPLEIGLHVGRVILLHRWTVIAREQSWQAPSVDCTEDLREAASISLLPL